MIPLGIYDDATNFKEIYAAMAKDEKESNNKSMKHLLLTQNAIFEPDF